MSTFLRAATRDDGETEITVEIAVNAWGEPAQTYGPPETCHDGSPMEVEIVGAWVLGDTEQPVVLTDAERARIETAFLEDPPEDDYPDYDHHRDEP